MGDAGSVWFGHSTVACPHATYGQQQGGHWQRHPISEVVVTLWRSIIFTQRLFETPSRCTMCHAAEKNCIGTRQFKVCEGFLTCRRAHRHTGIAYWCTRPKAKAVPSPQRRRPSLAPATSEPASPGTVEHLPARRPTRRTLSDRARPRSHSSEAVWPSQGCFLARTDQHAKPLARRQRGGLARGTDAWCPRGGITRQTKVRHWL